MTRKRGTAFRAALIASLAVAFGVGSSALATTPPSEPAGGGAAANAPATSQPLQLRRRRPQRPRPRRRPPLRRRPGDHRCGRPGDHRRGTGDRASADAARERQPSSTPRRPATSTRSRVTACSRVARCASPSSRWPRTGTPTIPTATSSTSRTVRQPMSYFPWLIDAEGDRRRRTRTSCSAFEASEDRLTLTYTLNPEAVWHNGDPITVADWQAQWNALERPQPEFQVVADRGLRPDHRRSSRAPTSSRSSSRSASRTRTTRRCSRRLSPAEAVADPETFNTGWIGPINNDWFTGPFEVGTYDDAAQIVELVPSDTWWGDRAAARLDPVHGDQP